MKKLIIRVTIACLFMAIPTFLISNYAFDFYDTSNLKIILGLTSFFTIQLYILFTIIVTIPYIIYFLVKKYLKKN